MGTLREGEMTVSALIEVLKTFDQDAIVVVDGYEGGFVSVMQGKISETQIDYLFNDKESVSGYWGEHEEATGHGDIDQRKAVLISR